MIRCAKCSRSLVPGQKRFKCKKCGALFCPSCMDRFCFFCKGEVVEEPS